MRSAGYAVAALDPRGQGLSDRFAGDRRRGHLDDFLIHQRDLEEIFALEAVSELPKPLFVLANSMGGAIAWRAASSFLRPHAMVLTAPMLGVMMPPGGRFLAQRSAELACKLGFSRSYVPGATPEPYPLRQGFVGNALTGSAEDYRRFQSQFRSETDLCLGGPTYGWVATVLRESKALRDLTPQCPTLIFCGTREWVVSAAAIRHAARRGAADLRWLRHARHGLLMERKPVTERVWSESLAFFAAAGHC